MATDKAQADKERATGNSQSTGWAPGALSKALRSMRSRGGPSPFDKIDMVFGRLPSSERFEPGDSGDPKEYYGGKEPSPTQYLRALLESSGYAGERESGALPRGEGDRDRYGALTDRSWQENQDALFAQDNNDRLEELIKISRRDPEISAAVQEFLFPTTGSRRMAEMTHRRVLKDYDGEKLEGLKRLWEGKSHPGAV